MTNYHATTQAISAIPASLDKSESEMQQGWQWGRENVEQLLEPGMRAAGRRAEQGVRNKTPEALAEDGEMAKAEVVFPATMGRGAKPSPGEVLQGLEKGVKRMTRNLLEDGD
ncbi:MAG: hypothetical protein M1822_009946 [Bathelium mastoideum]|nr:MAG: hypothetical protein M1822_009946 [Bathelium mastoideum]